MIDCEKAKDICNKSQYKEASLWERTLLSYHLLVCKYCKVFSSKNKELTLLCNDSELKSSLDKETKTEMKKKIQEKTEVLK